MRQYFDGDQSEINIIHGATSAYDKRVFDFLDTQPEDYILSEDGALSVLINLLNKRITLIDESLVCYRESEDSLTQGLNNKISYKNTFKSELAMCRFARSQANRCAFFLRIDGKYGAQHSVRLNKLRITNDLNSQRMLADWWQLGMIRKVRFTLGIKNGFELRLFLPRLLPFPIFMAAKTLLLMVASTFGRKIPCSFWSRLSSFGKGILL